MAQNQNIDVDPTEKELQDQKDAIERDTTSWEEEYKNANPERQAEMEAELFKYIPQEKLEELSNAIDAGDEGKLSDVLDQGLGIAMQVWLLEQKDNTKIPAGYRKLLSLIPIRQVANGAVVNDYQDYKPGDAKTVYYGSQKSQVKLGKSWVDLTVSDGELAGIERWYVSHIFHKQALTYKPTFSNSHKTTVLFAKQFNYLVKKIGQAVLDYLFAVVGKYLLTLTQGEKDIIDTDDGITFKPTALGKPMKVIEGSDPYELLGALDVYIRSFEVMSRKHLPDESVEADTFKINMGTDKNPNWVQLKRSTDLNKAYIICSNEFYEAVDKAVRATAFNQEYADMGAKVRDRLIPLNYEITFGDEYANITGLEKDLKVVGKDKMAGKVDIFIITPGTLEILQYFRSRNEFNLPNNTVAINMWFNQGLVINKWEDNFWMHLQLAITEAPTIGGDTK